MAACCLTSTILLLRIKSYRKLWAKGRLQNPLPYLHDQLSAPIYVCRSPHM